MKNEFFSQESVKALRNAQWKGYNGGFAGLKGQAYVKGLAPQLGYFFRNLPTSEHPLFEDLNKSLYMYCVRILRIQEDAVADFLVRVNEGEVEFENLGKHFLEVYSKTPLTGSKGHVSYANFHYEPAPTGAGWITAALIRAPFHRENHAEAYHQMMMTIMLCLRLNYNFKVTGLYPIHDFINAVRQAEETENNPGAFFPQLLRDWVSKGKTLFGNLKTQKNQHVEEDVKKKSSKKVS